jgi:hypothetical protein
MNIEQRIIRYQAIEAYRGRPLLVYATSTRQGVAAMMAGDAVREFVDQIDALAADKRKIDVLIHSTGGDGLTAWKLMSILRERFDHVSVLVPFTAFSAATIFALGADEIVMHPHSSLGPIDPQITTQSPDGKKLHFSYEDLGAFLRFLKKEAEISGENNVSAVVQKLFSTVDPLRVGFAQRASELSTSVGARLLLTHMKDVDAKEKAQSIAENLNKSFFAHGDAVSRSRAKELNLKIAASDPDLENLIWQAYLGLESCMDARTPFIPLHHFLADAAAAQSLTPIPPLNIPPNTPQQLIQQILQQIAAQALSKLAVEVPYSLLAGVIESPRLASEHRTIGKLTAWRDLNNEISISRVDASSKWSNVPIIPPAVP